MCRAAAVFEAAGRRVEVGAFFHRPQAWSGLVNNGQTRPPSLELIRHPDLLLFLLHSLKSNHSLEAYGTTRTWEKQRRETKSARMSLVYTTL